MSLIVKKPIIVLLFLVLSSQKSFSQISFFESIVDSTNQINIRNGNSSVTLNQSINLGDIDGDGDNDIILQADPLSWVENLDSLGNFGEYQIIDVQMNSESLKIADVDNDNDLDIVISGKFQGIHQLSWYENLNGQGNFGSIQTISNTTGVGLNLDIKDVDGDNFLDIVTSCTTNGRISWYKNLGNGQFSPEQLVVNATTNSNITTINIQAVDLDGDNDVDIIYSANAGADDALYFLENLNGQGNFDVPQTLLDVFGGFDYFNFTDFNNDGLVDLLYINYFDFFIMLNDGNGNLTFNNSFSTSFEEFYSYPIATDVDGDSDMDIVTLISEFDLLNNPTNNAAVIWYENLDGSGNFSSEQIIKNINITNNTRINLSDFNNDGFKDFISTGINGYELSWCQFSVSSGLLGDFNIIIQDLDEVDALIGKDIDGDGDEDIIFVSKENDVLGWYENIDGNGTFGNQKIISTAGNGVNGLITFDIDNNNTVDIVTQSSLDKKIRVYKNIDGFGNFILHQTITNPTEFSSDLNFFDIDSDGDLDLINLQNGGNEIVWFENTDGQGNFSADQLLNNTVDNIDFFKFSDLDNDGFEDIVIDNPLSWLKNLGNGNYTDPQLIIFNDINSFHILDIDSDNDNDILIYDSFELNWIENLDGLGNYGNPIFIDTVFSKNEIILDIDDDGDKDLISQINSISNLDKLVLYKNINGQYSEPILIDNNETFGSLLTSNFDGNAYIDFAYFSATDDSKIGWYRNLGVLDNELSGTVHIDIDQNGCNSNDIPASNVLMATSANGYLFATFTDNTGTFSLKVGEGEFNTLARPDLNGYFDDNPESINTIFVGSGNIENTLNFCRTETQAANDLNITIISPINDPRPGFDTSYQIIYSNIGTTQLSGDISFQFDDAKIQLLNASETVASQTTNSLTFDYANLNPFETRTIDLDFNVFPPPTTNIDDELISTVNISPSASDETQNDNTFTLEQTVIGSYDPNDIQILEGDQVHIDDADEYLHFLIRFQNTGTASAINVRVEHVLDNKLDWTTMQLQSLSHDGRVEITDGSDVQFIFNNINLPDSTSDEPNSHGYIAFKIKPLDNVAIGDIISSVADIYFDFNPPIITNTATTEFVDNLGSDDFSLNKISVYPNPTDGLLSIQSISVIDRVEVFDMMGRQLLSQDINQNNAEIYIPKIQNGVYFLKIESKGISETRKIIKN